MPQTAQPDTERGALTVGRRRAVVLVVLLVLLLGGFLGLIATWRHMEGADGGWWDRHDGDSVVANGSPATDSTEFEVGDRVLVEQGGAWWRGRVKQVNQDGSVAIHYVGWGSEWNEVVPRSRLQVP